MNNGKLNERIISISVGQLNKSISMRDIRLHIARYHRVTHPKICVVLFAMCIQCKWGEESDFMFLQNMGLALAVHAHAFTICSFPFQCSKSLYKPG